MGARPLRMLPQAANSSPTFIPGCDWDIMFCRLDATECQLSSEKVKNHSLDENRIRRPEEATWVNRSGRHRTGTSVVSLMIASCTVTLAGATDLNRTGNGG